MCQVLVREFLAENKNDWFTAYEIEKGTGLSPNSVFISCMKLRKHQQVFFKVQRRLVGKCQKDIIVYKYKRCL